MPNSRPCSRSDSDTVISGSRLGSWKTTPSRRRSGAESGCPSIRTDPACGARNPATNARIVLLPLPFGPSSPTTSPAATDSDTPATPRLTGSPAASAFDAGCRYDTPCSVSAGETASAIAPLAPATTAACARVRRDAASVSPPAGASEHDDRSRLASPD